MWPTVFQLDFETIGDDTAGALAPYFDPATVFLVLEYNGDDALGGASGYFDTQTIFLVLEYNGDDSTTDPIPSVFDSYTKFILNTPNGDGALVVASDLDSYTKLLLHFNSDYTDSSASGHTVTSTGASITSSERRFGAGSVSFDGTSSYLAVPDSTDFEFGSGTFTIDFWVHYTAWSGQLGYNCPIGKCYNSNTTNPWFFEISSSTVNFYHYNGGWINAGGSFSLILNTWHHIAVVRNSSNLITLYINGIATGTTRTYSGDMGNNSDDVTIGTRYIAGVGDWDARAVTGYIDELRVSKGIARWTTNFTPPQRQTD
jgi:hypothetical protein